MRLPSSTFAGAGSIETVSFPNPAAWAGNSSPDSCPGDCAGSFRRAIPGGNVPSRRFAVAHYLRNQLRDIHAGLDLATARHASRRIPIVGVVERGIDIIADRGIQSPGSSQRSVAQML